MRPLPITQAQKVAEEYKIADGATEINSFLLQSQGDQRNEQHNSPPTQKCWNRNCLIAATVAVTVTIVSSIALPVSLRSYPAKNYNSGCQDKDAKIDCSDSRTFNKTKIDCSDSRTFNKTKIDCKDSITFSGTCKVDPETTKNKTCLQENLQQKFAEIFGSSDLSSCFCNATVQSESNSSVDFELKFQMLQNKNSSCQAVDASVNEVLHVYICKKQQSGDYPQIKHISRLIHQVK